jgi:hypothetical protein
MTHYTRSKRSTAGFVPRTTILRVDQFTMEKIIELKLDKRKAPVSSARVLRRLEDILHMELSLSIARGVMTALDQEITTFFTVDITWCGHNVYLNIQSNQRTTIRDFLKTYPTCFIDKQYPQRLFIGERSGPCVIMFVSRIDTDLEDGK